MNNTNIIDPTTRLIRPRQKTLQRKPGGAGAGGGIVNQSLKILYKAHCRGLAHSFSFIMSVRMVLRSSESQGVFPQNQPWNFKLELLKWLHVTRDWTIELTEFYASNAPKSAKRELYVYCNVCETSLVKKAERSLLRRVFLENNKTV